jgi:hypothetical protein
MAVLPGRFRDELAPILPRNTWKNRQLTADYCAVDQIGADGPLDQPAMRLGRTAVNDRFQMGNWGFSECE